MLSSYFKLGIRACKNQKPPFLGLRNDNIISISRDEPLQARTEARKVRAPCIIEDVGALKLTEIEDVPM